MKRIFFSAALTFFVFGSLAGCQIFKKDSSKAPSREAQADLKLAQQKTPPSESKVRELLETPQPGYDQEPAGV